MHPLQRRVQERPGAAEIQPHEAAPVEVGHRSATFCHIANIAMRLKRKLRWNPDAEKFLRRTYRSGWDVKQA